MGSVEQHYLMDDDWHTYRLEVEGTTVRLLFDGRTVAAKEDTQFLESGQVRVISIQAPIIIRSFNVVAL